MNVITLVRAGEYIGVRKLRQSLSKIIRNKRTVFVTDHGKPLKAMIPYEMLLELLETVEELKDKMLLKEIVRGRREYQPGKSVPLTRLKKDLGL